MDYKVKENEVVKYYAEAIKPVLIHDTALYGVISKQALLSKFGLPTVLLAKIKDYLIAQGFIETG